MGRLASTCWEFRGAARFAAGVAPGERIHRAEALEIYGVDRSPLTELVGLNTTVSRGCREA